MTQPSVCRFLKDLVFSHLFYWALSGLTFFFSVTFPANAQTGSPKDQERISFEARLAFYLDQKSHNFLLQMAARERALMQLVRNVTQEIRQRGARAVLRDEAGFRELYFEGEQLVAEYAAELDEVLALIAEIDRLKRVVQEQRDQQLLEEVGDLKDRLVSLLEDRAIFRKAPYTTTRVRAMLSEYQAEVDSLLAMYQSLERFERLALLRGDEQILSEVEAQKRRIAHILSQWEEEPGVDDRMANEYLDEAQRLVEILGQLEQLSAEAIQKGDEVGIEIEALRREILASLDRRLLRLFGYDAPEKVAGPRVSEMFAEWKAERIAAFEVKRTEYEIIRNRLLQTGTEEERSRMLRRALADAMLNYAEGDYETSELQLTDILQAYGPYFPNLDAALFYRSETYYARKMLDLARPGYEEIVEQHPTSEYVGEAYFRLLQIAHTLGDREAFGRTYHSMMTAGAASPPAVLTKVNYLAGFHYLQEDSVGLAQQALAGVESSSRQYYPAQYLLAIAYLRDGRYDEAKDILLKLADKKSYPWSDNQTAFLRNSALLKLGFLAYEQENYQEALDYFTAVSKGFPEADRSYLGKAWTHLKRGEYDSTVAAVGEMFEKYLASNYTYEALVLAAHSKRLLDRSNEAMQDLRYVSTSRRIMEVTKDYNAERRYIVSLLDQIERMEEEVVDRQDRQLYDLISEIRNEVMSSLASFSYRGVVGRRLLDEYQEERTAILRQIEELDQLIQSAQERGMQSVLEDAQARRERLMKTLDTYQVKESVQNVNYFVDYPLATREAVSQYREEIYATVARDLEAEQARLQAALERARTLRATNHTESINAELELEIVEKDLQALQERLSRFRTWVEEHPVQAVDTKFETWADFSGYGLSDITFDKIRKDDLQITDYAENISEITSLLQKRQQELEKQIAEYDARTRRLEAEMRKQQIELDRRRREEYFRTKYFDVSTQERIESSRTTPTLPDTTRSVPPR